MASTSGTPHGSRAAIIAAAERLIAVNGLGAVSMRMVGEAAGQRNHSAVQFHFGTRDGLLGAIAAERMGPISVERLAMLEALDRAGRDLDVRGLVEALVWPLTNATLRRPGSYYARFLAVSYADPQWSSVVRRTAEGTAFEAWRARLEQALPRLAVGVRRVRVDHAVSMVITALARWESGAGRRGLSDRARVVDLIDTTVAFLVAPSSLPDATHEKPTVVAS